MPQAQTWPFPRSDPELKPKSGEGAVSGIQGMDTEVIEYLSWNPITTGWETSENP